MALKQKRDLTVKLLSMDNSYIIYIIYKTIVYLFFLLFRIYNNCIERCVVLMVQLKVLYIQYSLVVPLLFFFVYKTAKLIVKEINSFVFIFFFFLQ